MVEPSVPKFKKNLRCFVSTPTCDVSVPLVEQCLMLLKILHQCLCEVQEVIVAVRRAKVVEVGKR